MAQKFKKGDIVKIRTSGDTVMVVEYRVNNAGGIVNAFLGEKRYDENVTTDQVLCEGTIAKKFQRKYITEANLELITATPMN